MPQFSHSFGSFLLPSVLALALIAPLGASADVVYDEGAQGDLSGDRFAPTPFDLAEGSHDFFGVMAGRNDAGEVDLDYYSITIPDGYALASITLGAYVSDDFAAFLGIQPGAVFPDDPDTVSPGDLLGWAHFGSQEVDTDLLALMGTNGVGFTTPLAAGTYSFWAQQTGTFTEYSLTFNVVEVPAPAAAGAFAAAAFAASVRRRRP